MSDPIQSAEPDVPEAVVQLQMQAAFQDKLIADLDEVVRAFATRVEALERTVQTLQARLDDQADPPGPHDETPPHY